MKSFVTFISFLVCSSVYAQNNSLSNSQTLRNYSDRVGSLNSFARTIPVVIGNEVGSPFLFDDFKLVTLIIAVMEDTIQLKTSNYHLGLKTLTFKDGDKLESIQSNFIKSFHLKDGNEDYSFYNKYFLLKENEYNAMEPIDSQGFLEILYSSVDYSLFREWDLEITEPTYNVAMDVGTKEKTIGKKSEYILVINNIYHDDFRLTKKSMKLIFGNNYEKVKSFVKENDIDEEFAVDMKKLVAYLDTL